ncbi:uncharacterized protein LOC125947075 isoform X2 [Dermacentor silvarum]|uniref:uncharacterized protein LOC125947075 isoform X2 n=1 Tax=Dermacentor silvarum TaxID=543639 RepID=UPI002101C57F|nr:uncharacterized protein LOC125947075 isoform X2 [Dermacentor silvarum]
MLRNPFCFLVQVFAALVARPALCTCAHYGLGADHIGDGVHLQLSANDWRQINHLIETPFTVSAPALSTLTSSHVDTQASLKDDAPEESTSGLGRSTASNMLRNPFCFLVQVFAALVARPSLCTYTHYGLGADHIGDGVHLQLSANDWRQINHLIETPFTVSAPALSTLTSSHVDTQASLKDDAPEESTSGLGRSTASNMLRNPFCFLVQVFAALVARAGAVHLRTLWTWRRSHRRRRAPAIIGQRLATDQPPHRDTVHSFGACALDADVISRGHSSLVKRRRTRGINQWARQEHSKQYAQKPILLLGAGFRCSGSPGRRCALAHIMDLAPIT